MFKRIRHINYLMLLRVVGWLLLIESCFMLAPTAVAYIYGESDFYGFLFAVLVTFVFGIGFTTLVKPNKSDMGRHEGFLLTASVWIVFSIFGMIPFICSNTPLTVSEAFFESMSGFTTTGCSVLTSVDSLSHSVSLWRSLMQWIGGMGIILFTLAVLPMLNYSGGMQMFNAEVTGITHEKLRPRISSTAKSLWGMYFGLTAILVLLLWAGPMDIFDSVCHAFSAISTGGFSTHNDSLAFFSSDYLAVVMMVFMFLGGTSFTLIYRLLRGDRHALWCNNVFRAYVIMIGLFYVAITLNLLLTGEVTDWRMATIYPMFQVVSTITSTGFSVTDFTAWGPFVIGLMMILMFTGACAGSTSGGAKIDRMLLLLKSTRNELFKSLHPNAITNVRINDKVVPAHIVAKVIAFLCIYVMVIGCGGIILTALGLPVIDSFFSAFSCVSNTGFGTSIVSGEPANFDIIPSAGLWVLSLLMLIGRLELFTVLVLFTPDFWKK